MKAVLLAGGLGTRISEETHLRPKPMIEIGGKPILWHIMKLYSHYGINDFIICCGYKGYIIKEYFNNYFLHTSDVTFNLRDNTIEIHSKKTEPWKVTMIDTGERTATGGRLKRISDYLNDEEIFCVTYGDGLASIDLEAEVRFHKQHGKLATVASVVPPARYGALLVEESRVIRFREKPQDEGGTLNGGFFILNPKCLDLIDGDDTSWEETTLGILASMGELMAYEHRGFWQPMDTLREKKLLEEMWATNCAPWKIW